MESIFRTGERGVDMILRREGLEEGDWGVK